ncbi:MAG TPA: hypothetical protein VNM92_18430 [Thermoanaerobaculia bacterium]|nr:hypothetical protein [Thermoanaerobaculia bacterium]
MYTFPLHTSTTLPGCDPFNFFTSSDEHTSSTSTTVDLAGGCLVAVVGFLTIPLRRRIAAARAPKKVAREQQRKSERFQWRLTLATWPVIYACKRDGTAFLPGKGRGVPADAIFRMLQEGRDAAAVTEMLDRP